MSGGDYLDRAFDADMAAAIDGDGGELGALLAAHPAPFAAVRALIDMGVPAGFLAQLTGAGDLALAQVELLKGGRFAFGGPDRRLVLAVRDAGALVDLVALSSGQASSSGVVGRQGSEDQWALYRGAADFLGEELLARAVIEEWREVRLFATPLAWLRGGGEGVCVLDWSRTALSALRGLRESTTIVCERGAAERLRALLAHGGLPQVAEIGAGFRRAA